MRSIGNYIIKGRVQAIAVTSLITLFSLLLPPLSYLFSGVPVGLVTLRRGIYAGLQVIIGSYLVIFLFMYVVRLQPQIATSFLVGIWLPVWLCANFLRITESQGKLVVMAGVMGIVYIVATHLLMHDVVAWWQNWLDSWLTNALPVDQIDSYREMLTPLAPMLNALMACGLTLSIILTTIIARWWQGYLFNPGGFRQEFYNLQIPKSLVSVVIIGVILMVLGMAGPGTMVLDILILTVFLYVFQGIALVHRVIFEKKSARFWLYLMYFMLFLVPQVLLFLACVGIVDSWMRTGGKITDQNDNL